MKLLLDQNLSYRLVKGLIGIFPGSKHVSEVGLKNCNDIDILRYAINNDYIVVTHDEDFYELSFNQPTTPNIVWLRCGNFPRKQLSDLLIRRSEDIKSLMDEEDVYCIEITGD